ncbi:MAG: hypothetical protein JXD22_16005 [Sedimentisphaerales bacterium]|nr:hypothetical protein [Sedimentisphaerales bacterium]
MPDQVGHDKLERWCCYEIGKMNRWGKPHPTIFKVMNNQEKEKTRWEVM